MSGQSLVLLAVGLFASLVVTVAAVDRYLLDEYPPSEIAGLLWRVENALGRAQDMEISLASTEYGNNPETVRMVVRVLVSPVPALSIHYTEPESMRDQVVTIENDLLSHYLPEADLLVVKRWTGVPLAAVGLAGLDVSRLRTQWQQGTVTVQIIDSMASFDSGALTTSFAFAGTLTSTSLDQDTSLSATPSPAFDLNLAGFASAPSINLSDPLYGSYIMQVRDAKSGRLTQTLWFDRATFLVQKVVFFEDDRRVRTLEVERLFLNQGLTADEVLVLPRAASTIRG
ncbi:MAG: hypothetical protein WCQ45_06095 [bacterium]